MHWAEFKYLVNSDLYRHCGIVGWRKLLYHLVWQPVVALPGFKYSFFLRLCAYLRSKKVMRYTLYYPFRLLLYRYEQKYGIRIAVTTKIGAGLFIGNYSGIFVNTRAVIGKNFNISQGVVIGEANRGHRKGTAVIGDNVYVGPGAKIVGKVQIGDNVAIGANCVVVKDIPDNAVVVGVPGRIISLKGSGDYVTQTDY